MSSFKSFLEPLEERKFLACQHSISGFVFNDLNSNGKRDSGETGLSKVTVYLDVNNNKKIDTNEKSTTTDGAGNFSFSNVAPGAYIIRQIVPAGMSQTSPAQGFGIHLTIKSGQSFKNQFFGDVAMSAQAAILGRVWPDAQHTADSPVATQDLKRLKWHTTIDLAPQFQNGELLIHYGSPVITKNNTVIVPVKTTPTGGFELRRVSWIGWQIALDAIDR